MSYIKNTWAKGDTITSEKLNNIEVGIENATLPEFTAENAGQVLKVDSEGELTWGEAGTPEPSRGFIPLEWDANGFVTKAKLVDIAEVRSGYLGELDISAVTDIDINNLYYVESYAMANMSELTELIIPSNIGSLDSSAFQNCTSLTTVRFEGIPFGVDADAFDGCTAITDIYMPWAENEVANFPWGAINATGHYTPITYTEITDTWEQIAASIDDGTYKTKYGIHHYKIVDLGTEGSIRFEIVGFDKDDLVSGGKAPITFLAIEALATTHRMNPAYSAGTAGTGCIGGWAESEMRSYLVDDIKPLFPEAVRSHMALVTKHAMGSTTSNEIVDMTTQDTIWIPSAWETAGWYDVTGSLYTVVPRNKKNISDSARYVVYWLRSGVSGKSSADRFWNVSDDGRLNSGAYSAQDARDVVVGFCFA